ncbi:hypothetical protein BGZ72_001103 [Mortierella alpina]|nr:hypothetical protein BGZ72_001103 [Mortierella alpina]
MVILANNILVATGYKDFTGRPMPHVSAGAPHDNRTRQPLNNYAVVTKIPASKEAVIGSFLDLPKTSTAFAIHTACHFEIVEVRIKHDELQASGTPRIGHPISSRYEEEKNNKKLNSTQSRLDQEVSATVREEKKDGAGASNPPESALAHVQQELYCHNKLENANKPSDEEDDGEDSTESEKGEDQDSQDTSGSSQNSDDSSEGGDERDEVTDETYTDAEYIMDEDNLTSIRLHRLSPEKPTIPNRCWQSSGTT